MQSLASFVVAFVALVIFAPLVPLPAVAAVAGVFIFEEVAARLV